MIGIDAIVHNRGINKITKLETLRTNFEELFNKISGFATTTDTILYCFREKIFEQPKCQHVDCDNNVNIGKNNKFSKGCCLKHSQEITFLEKYGTVNPMKNHAVKEKVKKTNLAKFGVDNYSHTKTFTDWMSKNNPMKNDTVKEKVKKTNLDKFGVENVMQNTDIAEKNSKTHKRIYKDYSKMVKKTNIDRYGFENPLESKEIHKKSVLTKRYNNYYNRILSFPNVKPLFTIADYHGVGMYEWCCKQCNSAFTFVIEDGHIPICRNCNPFEKSPYSKGEKELSTWLKTLGINLKENDRTMLSGKELDILIEQHNLAIEFNGLYWHSELNGKDKQYHLNKTNQCMEKGIHLIHVLDRDWYLKQDIVKSIIKNKLGMSEKIYARKCVIKEIDSIIKNRFLEQNHLQGKDNAKIKLGLFYMGELIGVMTFGNPRFSTNAHEWELYRYAIKLNCSVVGGANKLFQYFINNFKPNSIITFADRRWFDARFYDICSMTRLCDTPPNYYYFKGNSDIIHRMSFQKYKLKNKLDNFDPELSEWENMQLHGYNRIWDCGNHKFEWFAPSGIKKGVVL